MLLVKIRVHCPKGLGPISKELRNASILSLPIVTQAMKKEPKLLLCYWILFELVIVSYFATSVIEIYPPVISKCYLEIKTSSGSFDPEYIVIIRTVSCPYSFSYAKGKVITIPFTQ